MQKYYENFSLVELQRTFYTYPMMSTVRRWREKAPHDFEFTVKAHQDISHRYRFQINESLRTFEQVKQICKALEANMLLIQTPGSFGPDRLSEATEFFHKVRRDNLTLLWETRGSLWDKSETRSELEKTLKTVNVPHVVDPFKAKPVYTGGTVYFRLHGMGKRLYYYQYSNKELIWLHKLAKAFEQKAEDVYVLFNNLAMLEDTTRFMYYIKTSAFSSVTGSVGLDSVRVLIEKIRYPATKSALLQRLGWRLVELEPERQRPLGELIEEVPAKTYASPKEVLKEIERIIA
jgi:uncharacterized protein YecE (DUF72 family)